MIVRISDITVVPPFMLRVRFDDGRLVLYDAEDDINQIPSYEPLRSLPGLFELVQLDRSRTCVYWNDEIDLPSDAIYEYGTPIGGE